MGAGRTAFGWQHRRAVSGSLCAGTPLRATARATQNARTSDWLNGQDPAQKRLDEELFHPLEAFSFASHRGNRCSELSAGSEAKTNRTAGQNRPGDLRAFFSRRPLLGDVTKADLRTKTKTPRTGNIGPGLTGGLVPSASEPAPSQRSSDLPQGARLPQNIESTLSPPLRLPSQNRTFLLCWE